MLPIAECFYLKIFSLFLQKKISFGAFTWIWQILCQHTIEQKIIFPQNYLLHTPQVFKAKKRVTHIPKILSSYIIFKIWTCPNLDVCSIFIRKTLIWKLWIQNDSLWIQKKVLRINYMIFWFYLLKIHKNMCHYYDKKNKHRKIGNSCVSCNYSISSIVRSE